MNKKKTTDFEIDGVHYTSKKSDYGCRGCSFENDFEKCVIRAPDCYGNLTHNPEIIFIKKN